jgi:tripartite-type tricarboxylate transporter receptor subunit TctC
LLWQRTGTTGIHVPYKGGAAAMTDLIGGAVDASFQNLGAASAHIKGGRLKALAIGGRSRLALLPEVPTFAEQGFPEIPSNAWFGLFAPAGTPREVILKLQGEIAKMLKEPEFNQREVAGKGYELVASTPEEFAAFLSADSARNAQAVKISGARVE